MRLRTASSLLLGLVVMGVACGSDDDSSASGSASEMMPAASKCEAEGTVDTAFDSEAVIDLGEWFVRAPNASLTKGTVKVIANNSGGDTHELVIVRGVSPDELTVVDGKVDEDVLPAGAFIGEIESFDARSSCDAVFELDAGSYSLFCNIVETEDDGSIESHFEEGMVTVVEVS